MSKQNGLVSIQEAAQMLGVSDEQLIDMVNDGLILISIRDNQTGILLSDVIRYMEKEKHPDMAYVWMNVTSNNSKQNKTNNTLRQRIKRGLDWFDSSPFIRDILSATTYAVLVLLGYCIGKFT